MDVSWLKKDRDGKPTKNKFIEMNHNIEEAVNSIRRYISTSTGHSGDLV